ncbi:MAG: cysteine--tRNA ligase [Thaumarchaeota archaeon]|nr:cysteine--tRNA ligase [Nitrososphaerota archaeon]
MLRLYNSLGRKVVPFEPIREGEVRMYTCGPTVWNYAHIGNFRTFTFEDVLRRYLVFKGYKVTQVKNLTDVEDKIIRGMKETGKSLKALTDFYSDAFMLDMEALNFQKADFFPRATQHIPEMVSMIDSLLRSGHAYKTDDGSVYYSIRTFERYGALSGVKPAELEEGARVSADHYEKMGAHDFALWKAWDPEDGEVFWETELGKGRPGWHIECSAMAVRYLGESFDIHTGGKDLRFPHHENEIAQSEAVTGKPFARYWLHAEFLNIEGEEMHKSSGNIVTVRELLDRGFNPRAIRLFLIGAHYRDELNLTDDSLGQAAKNIERADEFIKRLGSGAFDAVSGSSPDPGGSASATFLKEFEEAMDEDLNMPEALAAFYGFQRTINTAIDEGNLSQGGRDEIMQTLRRVDSVFGIMKFEKEELPGELKALILERERARAKGNYKRADELREELRRKGVVLQDAPGGTQWKRT